MIKASTLAAGMIITTLFILMTAGIGGLFIYIFLMGMALIAVSMYDRKEPTDE